MKFHFENQLLKGKFGRKSNQPEYIGNVIFDKVVVEK